MPVVHSYGTMPSERGQRRAGGFASARSMRLVATALFSSAALITMLTLARGPNTKQSTRRWLLQTQLLLAPTSDAPQSGIVAKKAFLAETSSEDPKVVGSEPTENDVASFLEKVSPNTMFLSG